MWIDNWGQQTRLKESALSEMQPKKSNLFICYSEPAMGWVDASCQVVLAVNGVVQNGNIWELQNQNTFS